MRDIYISFMTVVNSNFTVVNNVYLEHNWRDTQCNNLLRASKLLSPSLRAFVCSYARLNTFTITKISLQKEVSSLGSAFYLYFSSVT
jgi:hypothetical protein